MTLKQITKYTIVTSIAFLLGMTYSAYDLGSMSDAEYQDALVEIARLRASLKRF